ncbi:MAG TPA: hypothetical protein PLH72_06280 [Vicinamibacterales bacterium]|nr:hypothetical protein [Vicinamibacterales bacterium]
MSQVRRGVLRGAPMIDPANAGRAVLAVAADAEAIVDADLALDANRLGVAR